MTAGFSRNQRNTRGHRQRLQSVSTFSTASPYLGQLKRSDTSLEEQSLAKWYRLLLNRGDMACYLQQNSIASSMIGKTVVEDQSVGTTHPVLTITQTRRVNIGIRKGLGQFALACCPSGIPQHRARVLRAMLELTSVAIFVSRGKVQDVQQKAELDQNLKKDRAARTWSHGSLAWARPGLNR
jgi:hypothetical protein